MMRLPGEATDAPSWRAGSQSVVCSRWAQSASSKANSEGDDTGAGT
nr:hypothetical protein [Haloferax massiliensis]